MGWSESDSPDQTARVAVVTGANSGIGFETARAQAVFALTGSTRTNLQQHSRGGDFFGPGI